MTIKDIAERASVSPATVSRVLNNSGYVGRDTRERVEKAIAELGYWPDARARGHRGQPSKLVALIIPDISNVYYTAVSQAIEANLAQRGYNMLLGITGDSAERYINYVQLLWERRVDGMIYVPPETGEFSAHTRRLVAQGIPVVEVNRQKEADLLDCVLADNHRGAYQGTEYLTQLGHKRIALIVGSPEATTASERIRGYKLAMIDGGLTADPELIKIGSFSKQHGYQATEELLTLSNRPTAIFAASNRLLMGAMTSLTNHNLQVPKQMSVISFDDSEWLTFWSPPVTTVDIAVEEMGMLAVEVLLRRIRERDAEYRPRIYTLSTVLVKRESCARPKIHKKRQPGAKDLAAAQALD